MYSKTTSNMKEYWDWDTEYFENHIFRNVYEKIENENNSLFLKKSNGKIEFTVLYFMKCFNKLSDNFRSVNYNDRYRSVVTLFTKDVGDAVVGCDHRVISEFLHNMIGKKLNAKYISLGNKTITVFSLI